MSFKHSYFCLNIFEITMCFSLEKFQFYNKIERLAARGSSGPSALEGPEEDAWDPGLEKARAGEAGLVS